MATPQPPPFSQPLLTPEGRISSPWHQWFQTLPIVQQATEADAAAVSALTLNTGGDSVDRAAFNTALGTLVTEINAIKTVLNNLLAKLENAKILATP